MRAHKLVLLGNYPGLADNRGQRIGSLGLGAAMRRLAAMNQDASLDADQVRRFAAALHACRSGVRRVHMVDGLRRGALPLELYTRDGVGTMITSDAYDDLRRATIDDVAGILELIDPLERAGILVRRERRDIERTIDSYFVEERDGAIVACAAAHHYAAESAMELACLAVSASYRDTGRGDRLLEAVESEARRVGAARLCVLTTQTTHWFRERGFEEADLDSLPMERRSLYNYQRKSRVLVKLISP
jgi:amino-acid N-acetyltransferase